MNKFMLSITASSGEFYQGDCEDLTLPISDGIYGVQAGHNPVLVALHMGILHFVVDGKARDVLVGDGIAEVTPAYVMVLVDSAENPEDIDKNRAEAARIRAEERLQHKQSMHEYYQSKMRWIVPCSVCRPPQSISVKAASLFLYNKKPPRAGKLHGEVFSVCQQCKNYITGSFFLGGRPVRCRALRPHILPA